VGHQHTEAAVAQLTGGRVEGVGDRFERCLDQQPPGLGRTLSDRVQLWLREAPDHVVAQLTAPVQLYFDPLGASRGPQLGQALTEVRDVGDHVRAHVRGGHHGVGAVRHRAGEELHALGELGRTIVEAVKGVEVQLRSWRHRGSHVKIRIGLFAASFVKLGLSMCSHPVNSGFLYAQTGPVPRQEAAR